MLDTIILQLNRNQYQIMDYGRFGTTKEKVEQSFGGFLKWFNNPTSKDKQDSIYKPRVTLIKRGRNFLLKIEFSAPKLLYNNNLEELETVDFDKVVKLLQTRLRDMGVIVWTKHIEEAEVLSFHPSKNIVLSKGFTANLVIKELSKMDTSKRFDYDEKNFRNYGEVLQFYTRSHAFVIYDKINDLNKPQKRATDKDQTKQQLSIFNHLQEKNNRLEVLRLEIRLSLKQKMNVVLKQVGWQTNPTFKEIYNKDLCQKIVQYCWQDFFGQNNFVFNTNSNPQEILQLVLTRYSKVKIITAIKMVGLYMLSKDDEGIRGFRQIIDNYKPNTNWAVVKRDLKMLEDEIFTNSTWNFVKDIKSQIDSFKSIKLDKNGQIVYNEINNN